MKKLTRICLLFAGIAGLALPGWAADQKIGTFDLHQAFDSFYKTIESKKTISQESAEIHQEQLQLDQQAQKHKDEWRQLMDQANDQAVSAEQRAKSKKAAADKEAELEIDKDDLDNFTRQASARLEEKQSQLRENIIKEILAVVQAHAKAGRYTMVLDSSGQSGNLVSVVLYSNGQDDLTDGVIKELNVAAPPGSLDATNAPAIFTDHQPRNPGI